MFSFFALALLGQSPAVPTEAQKPAPPSLRQALRATGLILPYGDFTSPMPSDWPAPLEPLWREGVAECSVIATASPETGTSARCCAIRLSAALTHRLRAWKADPSKVPDLHADPVPLSTKVRSASVGPSEATEPLGVVTCPATPRELRVDTDVGPFARAVQQRWATLGGAAPPQRCTLEYLTHREPRESGGRVMEGETVLSVILRCGAVVAVDEIAPSVFVRGRPYTERLLATYADALCGPAGVLEPRAPAPAAASAKATGANAPPTVERCDGQAAALNFADPKGSVLIAGVQAAWAAASGTGAPLTCTASERRWTEPGEVLLGTKMPDRDVAEATFTCGELFASIQFAPVMAQSSRSFAQRVVAELSAGRCEQLRREAVAAEEAKAALRAPDARPHTKPKPKK